MNTKLQELIAHVDAGEHVPDFNLLAGSGLLNVLLLKTVIRTEDLTPRDFQAMASALPHVKSLTMMRTSCNRSLSMIVIVALTF